MTINRVLKNTKAIIAAHGWSVIAVADNPPFAYTAGLTTTFHHPELLMFGLAPDVMQGTLNAAGRLVREGQRLTPYIDVHEVLDGYPVRFLPVDLSIHHGYANIAEALSPVAIEVLQLCWPDAAGRFPFEPGFDPRYATIQPVIGTAVIRH
jgi:hypothetical protein